MAVAKHATKYLFNQCRGYGVEDVWRVSKEVQASPALSKLPFHAACKTLLPNVLPFLADDGTPKVDQLLYGLRRCRSEDISLYVSARNSERGWPVVDRFKEITEHANAKDCSIIGSDPFRPVMAGSRFLRVAGVACSEGTPGSLPAEVLCRSLLLAHLTASGGIGSYMDSNSPVVFGVDDKTIAVCRYAAMKNAPETATEISIDEMLATNGDALFEAFNVMLCLERLTGGGE
jgi:hypothetical protein